MFRELWRKLGKSKKYREEFVASQVKRSIPFQIRALLKKKHLSQDELAVRAKLTQGVVSRAANPNYGNLTLNTIIHIAAGFDLAFVGRFVPFSELARWYTNLSEEDMALPSFDEEQAQLSRQLAGIDEPGTVPLSILRGEAVTQDYAWRMNPIGPGPQASHIGAAQAAQATPGQGVIDSRFRAVPIPQKTSNLAAPRPEPIQRLPPGWEQMPTHREITEWR